MHKDPRGALLKRVRKFHVREQTVMSHASSVSECCIFSTKNPPPTPHRWTVSQEDNDARKGLYLSASPAGRSSRNSSPIVYGRLCEDGDGIRWCRTLAGIERSPLAENSIGLRWSRVDGLCSNLRPEEMIAEIKRSDSVAGHLSLPARGRWRTRRARPRRTGAPACGHRHGRHRTIHRRDLRSHTGNKKD